MYNFFVEPTDRSDNRFYITGSDFNHIKNALRMTVGEELSVSCDGESHLCRLTSFSEGTAVAEIIKEGYRHSELPIEIYLFQGLPKAEKAELIIQKAVELGVYSVLPCEMKRCVVRLDEKKKRSKQERWQAIAEGAAKQSKRNIIPEVALPLSFNEALKRAEEMDILLLPYENAEGMAATERALGKMKWGSKIGIFIGPEGGFEPEEVAKLEALGADTVSLGKRILRTETAAVTAVGMCMLYAEMKIKEILNDNPAD